MAAAAGVGFYKNTRIVWMVVYLLAWGRLGTLKLTTIQIQIRKRLQPSDENPTGIGNTIPTRNYVYYQGTIIDSTRKIISNPQNVILLRKNERFSSKLQLFKHRIVVKKAHGNRNVYLFLLINYIAMIFSFVSLLERPFCFCSSRANL